MLNYQDLDRIVEFDVPNEQVLKGLLGPDDGPHRRRDHRAHSFHGPFT